MNKTTDNAEKHLHSKKLMRNSDVMTDFFKKKEGAGSWFAIIEHKD